jgi:hypothetical protein
VMNRGLGGQPGSEVEELTDHRLGGAPRVPAKLM